ncbi:3-ketoacyl-CoA synthase 11 [Turnera subulata]|uniref:3-ketoacyl-CoA synthase n=1 Tax=Turnera subulata TaxID=218843 RepID=A0A9Q0FLH3_9ROSI|nr:3-ketoacyl-CoA synthase 11 [Turnera subulata]
MADDKKQNLENKPELPQAPPPEEKKNNLPNFLLSVELKYVKLGYHYLVSNALYLILLPLLGMILTHLSTLDVERTLLELWNHLGSNFIITILGLASAVFVLTAFSMSRPRKVFLVDFACYKPDPSQKSSKENSLKIASMTGYFSEESMDFQRKILERAGYGQMTYAPKGLLKLPQDWSMAEALRETDEVMFGAIDELLSKTGVKPRDIGILVVNSSLFNPTPSLSARVVNRYKLRGNILSFSLGGMGCSAGIISIDLAKDLLQVHPNTYALVVSTENITRNAYHGDNKHMLVANSLFRVGGAAILLSNRPLDRFRSKYQLSRVVRTHKGADDKSFNSVMQQEDENKQMGVYLSKELMIVAGEALKTNISTLGPLVLPFSEQLLFLASLIGKKIFKMNIKPYVPDFKLAFEHFCLHAGGRAVLDELEKHLDLPPYLMEPSRMTLYRFGNTSSSSVWYELAYSEAKGRVKRGDRVWQIGLGSGFKCNSAVWEAIRTINPAKERNPWMEEIHEFPVDVPRKTPIVY